MKIKCDNCRLQTKIDFPSVKCTHCWEVFNLKKHKEYVLAKKILMSYGFSSKRAKKSLEIILTRRSSTSIIDAPVLVKLAFANKIG